MAIELVRKYGTLVGFRNKMRELGKKASIDQLKVLSYSTKAGQEGCRKIGPKMAEKLWALFMEQF